ncbi:MAG: hypothetical protein JXR22_10905 [Prolixibacteraceae bacterium]|nr:hypothetical protein [Prolixibacteraceae bacterium]
MKTLYSLVIFMLIFAGSAFAQKAGEIPLAFGKSPEQLSGIFVPTGEKIAGMNSYVRADESYEFKGLTAHAVSYGFSSNQLALVQVGLFSKDLTKIVEFMTGSYGKPAVSMANGMVNYKWESGGITAFLLFNKDDGKGIELSISNKGQVTETARSTSAKSTTSNTTTSKAATPAPKAKEPEKPAPAPCQAESLYEGFKCMAWGTPFDEMEGRYTKYEGGSAKKFDDFERSNDEMKYEGIPTSAIIYSFHNDLFQAASMAMYNKDVNKIVKLWTSDYGEPRVVDGAGFFTNYEWHLDGLQLTITYIHEKEDGVGVLASMVCENDNFSVKKPAIQSSRSSARERTVPASTSKKETVKSSPASTGVSARDRMREKSVDDEEQAAPVVKKQKIEIEEVEETEDDSTEGKSKRDLMREKKR